MMIEGCGGFFMLDDFFSERAIGPFQLRRRRHCEHLRHERDQETRCDERHRCRHKFDHSFRPVDRVPQDPDGEQMRGTAKKNESSKHAEDPGKCEVISFADQINEGDRNGNIGEGNRRIRSYMQPEETGIPHRHWPCGKKLSVEKFIERLLSVSRDLLPWWPESSLGSIHEKVPTTEMTASTLAWFL